MGAAGSPVAAALPVGLAVWATTVVAVALIDAGVSPWVLLTGAPVAASWLGVWAWVGGRWSLAALCFCVWAVTPWLVPFVPGGSLLLALPAVLVATRRARR